MIYKLILIIVLAVTLLALYLRRKHVEQTSAERCCKRKMPGGGTCKKKTHRRHQMIIPKRSHERVGRWSKLFRALTFDECGEGHVKLVEATYKRFSLIKLAWRFVFDPRQFDIDETLFVRAGMIDQPQPDLLVRIKRIEAEKERAVLAKKK